MKRYWVSWFSDGPFTLEWPWWISGERMADGMVSFCAAVQAPDEESARDIIKQAMDDPEQRFEWRFYNERPDDWSPFCERFQRADWMKWD